MAEQTAYQIRIKGWIDKRWADWFDGWTITHEEPADQSPLTVLTGPVVDQAALRGILCLIWDLNLTVLSVNPVGEGPTGIRRGR